jgi:hypothetical protein
VPVNIAQEQLGHASSAARNSWSGITRQRYRRRHPFQFSDSTGTIWGTIAPLTI